MKKRIYTSVILIVLLVFQSFVFAQKPEDKKVLETFNYKKNADVELLTIKNAGHSFSGSNISPSFKELNQYSTNFILSHLRE